jgi:hypothetical protein
MASDFETPFDYRKVDYRRALGPEGYNLYCLLERYHNEFRSLRDRVHRLEEALCAQHEGNRIKLFGMSQTELPSPDSQGLHRCKCPLSECQICNNH